MPVWDTNLNLPLLQRTYKLGDIINKQNYLSVQADTGGNIYLLQANNFNQNIAVSNFIKTSGTTSLVNNLIQASNFQTFLYLQLPGGMELDSALFTGGIFSFNYQNTGQVPITFIIKLPGVKKQDGLIFNYADTISAGKEDSVKINFAGYSYKLPTDQPSFFKNCINIIVQANASTTTTLRMSFYNSNFTFSYASGIIPPKSLGINSQNFLLNIGNAQGFRDKTNLRDAELNINVAYITFLHNLFSIGVNKLNIEGLHNDGSPSVYLRDANGNKDLSFIVNNGYSGITFTNSNSNIAQFISSLPDKVNISGDYIMNPDSTYGAASILDVIRIQTGFSTHSYISINNASVTDTSQVELTTDDKRNIESAKDASILLSISNGIPISNRLKVTFLDSLKRELFTLKDSTGIDSIYFSGAETNIKGEVLNPVLSNRELVLNTSEIELFSKSKYVVLTIVLSTSGNNTLQTVALRPEDEISIKALGIIKYRTKF